MLLVYYLSDILNYIYSREEVTLLNIADRIRFFREQKKITVNKLANLSGISQSFLREIELGNKNPTVETIILLCGALNITLGEFFNDNTPQTLLDNELLQQIYRLTPKQQEYLKIFLKSL